MYLFNTKICCFVLVWMALPYCSNAQSFAVIKGKIVEMGTDHVIAGASVFNGMTNASTVSKADGSFEILADTLRDRSQFCVRALGYSDLNCSDYPNYYYYYHREQRIDPYFPVYCGMTDPAIHTRMVFLEMTPLPVQLTREVVITAQKMPRLSVNTPRSVTILDKKDLLEYPDRSIPESLSGTTGVWLQKTNHGGGSPFLRGLTGQQNLLLLDGIRLNNAVFRSGPNQYLNLIDPIAIRQIEVLRGHGSAEYGSDALGGVINLLTPDMLMPAGLHGRIQTGWATQQMEKSASAEVHWTDAKRHYAIWGAGAYRNFGDLWGGKGIGRQTPSGYDQWSYQVKGLKNLGNKAVVQAFWKDVQQNEVPVFHKVQLENFAFNQFDPQRHQMGYVRISEGTARYWNLLPTLTVSWQRQLEGRQSQKNGSPKIVRERDEVHTLGVQLQSKWSLVNWSMRNGIDFFTDKVRSTKTEQTGADLPLVKRGLYPDGAQMRNFSAFSLHSFHFFYPLRIDAGLRWSKTALTMQDETLGNIKISPAALVGNLGGVLPLGRHFHSFAQVSSAFRAPNIDDLGTLGIVDFRYEVPNVRLKPEQGRNIETGIKFQSDAFASNFSLYYNALNRLIGRVSTADSLQGYPVYQKKNIGNAYITGVEWDAEWRLHRYWIASANFTYTYGQNRSDHEPLRRIPPAFGQMALRYTATERLSFRVEGWGAAAQRRLAKADVEDNRIADDGTPGWIVWHAAAVFQYKKCYVNAEIHNVFNQAYRIHGSGIDGTGRSLWIKTSIAF